MTQSQVTRQYCGEELLDAVLQLFRTRGQAGARVANSTAAASPSPRRHLQLQVALLHTVRFLQIDEIAVPTAHRSLCPYKLTTSNDGAASCRTMRPKWQCATKRRAGF